MAAALPLDVTGEILTMHVAARAFCAYGQAQGYWQQAEEFLAIVDAAATDSGGSHASRTIRAMLKDTVRFPLRVLDPGRGIPPTWRDVPGPLHAFDSAAQLAYAARLAVLADCTAFVRGANVVHDEVWSPFVKWARSLSGADTVITFNYDPVPELLMETCGGMAIIAPGRVEGDLMSARGKQIATIFKLHGSTTWALVGDSIAISKAGVPLPFTNPNAVPLMGFPGPTKVQTCNGRLKPLWDEALKSLRAAEEVIFIGYRFPPTDAFAREQILGALRDGHKMQLRTIKTVLGDTKDPLAVRLAALIDAAAQGIHKPVPLLAQDFMDADTLSPELTIFDVL